MGASRQQRRWFPLLIERFFSPSSRQRLTTSYRCGKQVFISVLSPLPSVLPSHKYVITIIQHPAIQIPITFCHSSPVATRFEDKGANVEYLSRGDTGLLVLETKVIRMFPKNSQSQRRPLLGSSPG